jgi:hypothetical protein
MAALLDGEMTRVMGQIATIFKRRPQQMYAHARMGMHCHQMMPQRSIDQTAAESAALSTIL